MITDQHMPGLPEGVPSGWRLHYSRDRVSWRYGSPSNDHNREVPTCHRTVLAILDGGYALLFERALQRLVTGNTRDAAIDA